MSKFKNPVYLALNMRPNRQLTIESRIVKVKEFSGIIAFDMTSDIDYDAFVVSMDANLNAPKAVYNAIKYPYMYGPGQTYSRENDPNGDRKNFKFMQDHHVIKPTAHKQHGCATRCIPGHHTL